MRKVITEDMLTEIALGEVYAIMDCLKDPDMRTDPKFLNHVRRFLKDHALEVTPQVSQVVHEEVKELPIFDD